MRRLPVNLLAALALAACGAEDAYEDGAPTLVEESDLVLSPQFARSYWQAFYETPRSQHPLLRVDRCTVGVMTRPFQMLLGGVVAGSHFRLPPARESRHCELQRRPVLVPVVVAQRDLALVREPTDAQFRAARSTVAAFVRGVTSYEVRVNGERVAGATWTQTTPEVFGYFMPEDDPLYRLPATASGKVFPAFGGGVFVALPALDPGTHLIQVTVRMKDSRWDTDAAYLVTVR